MLLRSLTTAAVFTIAALMVLSEFEVNLAPLIAGAGIAGVALGFGAQSLVKDFLSGMFISSGLRKGAMACSALGSPKSQPVALPFQNIPPTKVPSSSMWSVGLYPAYAAVGGFVFPKRGSNAPG